MYKSFISVLAAVIFLLTIIPFQGKAGTDLDPDKSNSSLLQLSLFPPLQLIDMKNPVEGFRLGLVPVNSDMTGLDIGLVTWTSHDLVAVELGLVHIVENNATGVQFGTLNIVGERAVGWQAGLVNIDGNGFVGFQQGGVNVVAGTQSLVGLQFGAVNYARNMTGVQLGLVNITPNLSGIQVGIVNYAGNSGIPLMVIANAAF